MKKKKNSEHTDPIEERGDGELVNQSAARSLFLACTRVVRTSGGLPLPLPQESSVGVQTCMEQMDFLSPLPHCCFPQVSTKWFSEPKHVVFFL